MLGVYGAWLKRPDCPAISTCYTSHHYTVISVFQRACNLGMQINFLGTGSAEPSKYRGGSAIHIRLVTFMHHLLIVFLSVLFSGDALPAELSISAFIPYGGVHCHSEMSCNLGLRCAKFMPPECCRICRQWHCDCPQAGCLHPYYTPC